MAKKEKDDDGEDEGVYGYDAEKDEAIDDDDMGYAASLDWPKPKTQEHPTNAISDSHKLTSSWWTKGPSHGQA